MKTTALAALIVVALALFLALVPVSRTYAADPTVYPGGLPWGAGTPWPAAMPLSVGQSWSATITSYTAPSYSMPPPSPAPNPIVVAPLPAAVPVPAPQVVVPAPAAVSNSSPAGNGPFNAWPVDGNMHTLGAGASAWHNIGTANASGVHMDVTLNTNISADGVDLSIFAPNQLGDLSKPVGHGTRSSVNANSQRWSGGGSYRVYGSWYARITNKTGAPVQYQLTSNQTAVAGKTDCDSYWESLLGHPVYWTACK